MVEGEDTEDLTNPNLVDLTFCKAYIHNFDSFCVHNFETIEQISGPYIQLWLGGNTSRCFMQVRYWMWPSTTGRHGGV